MCAILTNIGNADWSKLLKLPQYRGLRCVRNMNDPADSPKNPLQADSRENLFFFLQTLAREAQARANQCKSGLELPLNDEQIKK
jgi:hypothetical protein